MTFSNFNNILFYFLKLGAGVATNTIGTVVAIFGLVQSAIYLRIQNKYCSENGSRFGRPNILLVYSYCLTFIQPGKFGSIWANPVNKTKSFI